MEQEQTIQQTPAAPQDTTKKKSSTLKIVLIVLAVLCIPLILCGCLAVYSFIMVQRNATDTRGGVIQYEQMGQPCLTKNGQAGILNKITQECEIPN